MADDDVTTPRGLHLPSSAMEWSFTRGSGPGGQHRNTADTAVVLEADLAELTGPGADRVRRRLGDTTRVQASDSRSQWRNRASARAKLVDALDEAARPVARRRKTRPSRGARERRLEEKRQHSEKKSRRRWRPEH